MYGTNLVAKARTINEGFLVHSIFYTIQGEGPFAGRPAIFVRFAGCNLRCAFCDTDFEGGNTFSLIELTHEIGAQIAQHSCPLVVMTGGEPMLQPIHELILELFEHYPAEIQIETAGTVWPIGFGSVASCPDVTFVCSPKTPKINPNFAHVLNVHYKYIIEHGKITANTGLPIGVYVPDINSDFGFQIWVQPCDVKDDELRALNMKEAVTSALEHGHRLSIQTHKIAGVP